ncbi:MAG TPA: fibronectin type III domain-containing protein, partial [Arthrobacter sp.]|nr:fibronectin type III domain-containing protein [Arthrobacter sp.]
MQVARTPFKRGRRLAGAAATVLIGLTSLTAVAAPASAAPPGTNDSPACSSASVRLEQGTGRAPQNLCVPAAATDDTTTLLVWNKPDLYDDVVDYRVYRNGATIGTAEQNARQHSPAQEYVDAFRAKDTDGFHARTVAHNYTATGLSPNTTYTFSVTGLRADGTETPASEAVTVTTAPKRHTVVVTDPAFKAAGD